MKETFLIVMLVQMQMLSSRTSLILSFLLDTFTRHAAQSQRPFLRLLSRSLKKERSFLQVNLGEEDELFEEWKDFIR